MKQKSRRFTVVDILLLLMMALPYVVAMVLKILTTPAESGINVTGARIYFTIPMPFQDLPITESQVNSWLVIITIFGLCLFLTRNLKTKNISVRQHVAEWLVQSAEKLVKGNMQPYFADYGPFIASVLALSAFSSLMSLVGVSAPTADLNVVAGWAILVFVLITHYKMKAGPLVYAKSFADPVLLTPLNIISEVATPVSMAFRHYGNVLSGSVISVLVGTGLRGLSRMLLGWLPGVLGEIPFLQIGIPAILSVYFDIFSSLLQAYIFAMLTMMYISGGLPMEEMKKRKAKRLQKANQKS